MSKNTASTRRMFLKGGALLAAPLAAASVAAVALADGDLKHRVTRLEDEVAIRNLHQSWLRQIDAVGHDAQLDGSIRRISAHPAAAADKIEIAASGVSAVGHFDCAVDLETPLAPDSTLAKMAHAQGNGTVRCTQRRLLSVDYTKGDGAWRISGVRLERV